LAIEWARSGDESMASDCGDVSEEFAEGIIFSPLAPPLSLSNLYEKSEFERKVCLIFNKFLNLRGCTSLRLEVFEIFEGMKNFFLYLERERARAVSQGNNYCSLDIERKGSLYLRICLSHVLGLSFVLFSFN
jgi:hypothetical protein